jgi:hypothetical protein
MDTGSARWRTSSYSGTGGGQCVEVGQPAAIAVRDSKDSDGTTLAFPATAWQEFINGIK